MPGPTAHPPRASWRKRAAIASGIVVVGGALLFVPEPAAEVPTIEPHAFSWNADGPFDAIRQRFEEVRRTECAAQDIDLFMSLVQVESYITVIERAEALEPSDPSLGLLETALFRAGAETAACPARLADLLAIAERGRAALKRASRRWDLSDRTARDRLYRSLYGLRAAVEEAMAQGPLDGDLALSRGTDEPCAGPHTTFHGVRICSGDIFLSRGGAPTSALIARGNDYPGNFSHVALAHVSEAGDVNIVEAHIERGVAISSVSDYLADKKFRILVLRLRADHPALVREPALPHRAATSALEDARTRHIPYDFEMDFRDPSAMFCTEIATAPYAAAGVPLFENLSTFSTPTLVGWLASLGVRNYETQAPADLEIDPSVVVVAEWRALDVLEKERIHNAVIDAMLAEARPGEPLPYDATRLPVARLAKAWSWILNRFGRVGPVPEGMSATVALRADGLRERHAAAEAALEERAARFAEEHGYEPPYWELVRLAETVPGL